MFNTQTYLIALILVLNIWTFALFGLDKVCAIRGWRRISENTLLMWSVVGGSIGAKLAQKMYRHKTIKQPFARQLNVIVVFHILVVAGLIYITLMA